MLGGLLSVAALTGAVYWWWTGPRAWAEAEGRAAAELASFEVCLLGERGLEPDAAERRRRGLVLAGELGAPLPEGWPSRCREHLANARGHLEAVPAEDGPEGDLRRQLEMDRGRASEAADADALGPLLSAIRAAGLPEVDAPAASPSLPAPATPIAAGDLSPLGEGGSVVVERDGAPGLVVRGRGAEGTTTTACVTPDDEALDLRCGASHRAETGASFRLLPRAAAAPALAVDLSASPSDAPVWDALSWQPAGAYLRVGFVRSDALVHGVRLEEPGKPTSVVRGPVDGERTETPLPLPFPNARPLDALVLDRAAVIRWEEPGKRTEDRAYAIDEDGTYVERAAFDGVGSLRAICPIEGGLALVRTSGARSVVDVLTADGERVSHEVERGEGAEVRCLADAVSFLAVERAGGVRSVTRVRCDASGCERAEGRLEHRALGARRRLDLLDLGDRVVIATAGGDAPSVVVVAPIDALANASPRVVVDAVAYGGPPVIEPILVAHRDGALLFLRDDGSVRAVVVDRDGTPRPARVERRTER